MKNQILLPILLAILISACSTDNTSQPKEEKHPNILLIIADDLGYADISATKLSTDAYTPNIDRLVNSGIRFTEAYDNSPICNQSRTGIITGCYPQRLGSFWYSSEGLHDPRFVTIAELLKQQNYATGYVGKVHYGISDSDTTNRSFPLNHGFDYFFGHTSPRKHYFHHLQEMEDAFQKVKKEHNKKGQSLRQGPLWNNTEKIDTLAFLTTLIGDKSKDFIKQNQDKPFFLQVAFNAAHNFTHQLPKEYLEQNKLSGYHDWNPAKEEYYEWYQQGRFPNNEEGRKHFLGQVHYMDYEIGRILKQLEDSGLIDNTLVFFLSDNGGSTPIYANNYPLKGSKYLLYEGGIKTQLIVSYPNKYPSKKVFNNVVSAMDIFPTICNEVGMEVPTHIDGINLSPLLMGKNNELQHELLFWDTGHELAVRKGNWKLRKAFNDGHAKYEMVDLELGEFLYNLESDMGEETNLKAEQDSIATLLSEMHARWKAELGF